MRPWVGWHTSTWLSIGTTMMVWSALACSRGQSHGGFAWDHVEAHLGPGQQIKVHRAGPVARGGVDRQHPAQGTPLGQGHGAGARGSMLRKATPHTTYIVWRRRGLLLHEVDAHPAENALSGVDRGQPVARRVHQRQEPLVAVGHLLGQVL